MISSTILSTYSSWEHMDARELHDCFNNSLKTTETVVSVAILMFALLALSTPYYYNYTSAYFITYATGCWVLTNIASFFLTFLCKTNCEEPVQGLKEQTKRVKVDKTALLIPAKEGERSSTKRNSKISETVTKRSTKNVVEADKNKPRFVGQKGESVNKELNKTLPKPPAPIVENNQHKQTFSHPRGPFRPLNRANSDNTLPKPARPLRAIFPIVDSSALRRCKSDPTPLVADSSNKAEHSKPQLEIKTPPSPKRMRTASLTENPKEFRSRKKELEPFPILQQVNKSKVNTELSLLPESGAEPKLQERRPEPVATERKEEELAPPPSEVKEKLAQEAPSAYPEFSRQELEVEKIANDKSEKIKEESSSTYYKSRINECIEKATNYLISFADDERGDFEETIEDLIEDFQNVIHEKCSDEEKLLILNKMYDALPYYLGEISDSVSLFPVVGIPNVGGSNCHFSVSLQVLVHTRFADYLLWRPYREIDEAPPISISYATIDPDLNDFYVINPETPIQTQREVYHDNAYEEQETDDASFLKGEDEGSLYQSAPHSFANGRQFVLQMRDLVEKMRNMSAGEQLSKSEIPKFGPGDHSQLLEFFHIFSRPLTKEDLYTKNLLKTKNWTILIRGNGSHYTTIIKTSTGFVEVDDSEITPWTTSSTEFIAATRTKWQPYLPE